MLAAALLLLVGLAHFAPEALAELGLGTVGAWDYVTQGAAAAALWLAVGLLAAAYRPALRHVWLVQAVATLGLWESLQRPVCRLLLPMHSPPATNGRSLCEAALGAPINWLGLVAALLVALVVQEAGHGRERR